MEKDPQDHSEMPRSAVLKQLEIILSSSPFQRSPTMRKLLSHVVTHTLDGKPQQLTGYAIGLDVFGRTEAFDPAQDSLVRVHMNRLRKLLAAYYATTAQTDDILIKIPRGSYTASFALRSGLAGAAQPDAPGEALEHEVQTEPNDKSYRGAVVAALALLALLLIAALTSRSIMQPPPSAQDSRPVLAILPVNQSIGSSAEAMAEDATSLLTAAFGKPTFFRVALSPDPGQPPTARTTGSPLIHVRTHLLASDSGLALQMSLLRTSDREVMWTAIFEENGKDSAALSRLVIRSARELHLQTIEALRRLLAKAPAVQDQPWFLVLNATWSPGEARDSLDWEIERIEFARKALIVDPGYMPAHAVLADKLAYLANVDRRMAALGAREKATEHARKALSQASTDSEIAGNIANYYWHMGQIDFSTKMASLATSLNPSSPVPALQSRVHAYTCAQAPAEVLRFVEDFNASLVPSSPMRWLSLTWLNQLYLNNGDMDSAIEAGQSAFSIFHTPDSALRLAVALAAVGRLDEAEKIIGFIAPNWPNLDLHAYAIQTMGQRCTGQDQASQVLRLYKSMAESLCSRSPDMSMCTSPPPASM